MGEHNRTLATDIQLKANTTHITPLQLHNKAKYKHKEENMNSMISTVSRKTCIARKANSRRVAMRAVRNGSRVCMMQTYGFMKKFECSSYLPPLSDEDVAKQIQYLLNQGWSPCIEFAAPEASESDQKVIMGPGYYDNRYYTMWKLPMFGCSDPQAVLNEIAVQKGLPKCRSQSNWIRLR